MCYCSQWSNGEMVWDRAGLSRSLFICHQKYLTFLCFIDFRFSGVKILLNLYFVFNYVKILDDIHFFVICFVIVFYTSIFRNVFSLICLSYKKCLNNMFWFFFPNYTYVFQQPQLLHHCMFLYKHGAKPLLLLFVRHFHLPLLFFHCCQYPI